MSDDRKHFDLYKDQTRAKHQILTKYVTAFFKILSYRRDRILYLDAFAGAGHYEEDIDGSPLRAMSAIKDGGLSKKAIAIFIERDRQLFEKLKPAVETHARSIGWPDGNVNVMQGEASNLIRERLLGKDLPPTFAFLDPCGVEGLDFSVVSDLLSRPMCECFVFFNTSALMRIAGLSEDQSGDTLNKFFGSDSVASRVRAAMAAMGARAKEDYLLSTYVEELEKATKRDVYHAPFRIEYEDRASTSHHLVHLTKNPIGFRIMKDVMWKHGADKLGLGGLTLLQKSRVEGQLALIEVTPADLERSVLDNLPVGDLVSMELFLRQLPEEKGNCYCEKAYKGVLLSMEEEGRIEVLQKGVVKPANKRRKHQGKPTLGETCFIRRLR